MSLRYDTVVKQLGGAIEVTSRLLSDLIGLHAFRRNRLRLAMSNLCVESPRQEPSRMSNFRTIDRQTAYQLPPSVDDGLPEKHLSWFIVDVVEGMDLGWMSGDYRGTGSASCQLRMLLGLLE